MIAPIVVAGIISAAGSLASSVAQGAGSQVGSTELIPPALGFDARRQFKGPLSAQLGNLMQGGGGFGPGYMGRMFQQAQSTMAPAMREANKSLNFAQMRSGIHDSGVALQQQAGLQNAFLSSLSRSSMDIVLQNEVIKRQEMMQAMGMLMSGISLGGTMQQPGGMTTGGVVGQGVGDAMQMYGLSQMFNQNTGTNTVNQGGPANFDFGGGQTPLAVNQGGPANFNF